MSKRDTISKTGVQPKAGGRATRSLPSWRPTGRHLPAKKLPGYGRKSSWRPTGPQKVESLSDPAVDGSKARVGLAISPWSRPLPGLGVHNAGLFTVFTSSQWIPGDGAVLGSQRFSQPMKNFHFQTPGNDHSAPAKDPGIPDSKVITVDRSLPFLFSGQ